MQVPHVKDSTTEPGCGVTATVEGQNISVGRLDWVQQQARQQSHSSASTSSNGSSSSSSTSSFSNHSDNGSQSECGLGEGMSGQSVVYVGLHGHGVIGALGFSDTLRADSQYVVQQLRSRGIRVVVTASGK